jgi:hypothetical protein
MAGSWKTNRLPALFLSLARARFLSRSLALSRTVVCVCVCVCEREREREREKLQGGLQGRWHLPTCIHTSVCVHAWMNASHTHIHTEHVQGGIQGRWHVPAYRLVLQHHRWYCSWRHEQEHAHRLLSRAVWFRVCVCVGGVVLSSMVSVMYVMWVGAWVPVCMCVCVCVCVCVCNMLTFIWCTAPTPASAQPAQPPCTPSRLPQWYLSVVSQWCLTCSCFLSQYEYTYHIMCKSFHV